MQKIKSIFILFLLFFLFLFVTFVSYASSVSSDLSDNFFRLHIIANSNSKEDQELKLKIRDTVISYMNTLNYNNLSKEQAINITEENLNNLKRTVEETIRDNGFKYSCNLEIGNYYFPTKYYGNISLPSGYYDALKINIGDAKGKNWWCSLYPPLCFTDVSSGVIDEESQEYLKNNLTDDEYLLISKGNEDIKIKFKIVELISKCYNSRPLRYT